MMSYGGWREGEDAERVNLDALLEEEAALVFDSPDEEL